MNSTQPKPFAFVLMPFQEDFDDIYKFGIRAACQDAGAYCERVDEQFFEGSILERIYNQIGKADVIIADLTGRNPNVFYETGYAHALGKRVILLTQQEEDIPFDFKHYTHLIYNGKIDSLKGDLEKRVRWIIDNPTKTLASVDPMVELYLEGVLVEEKATLSMKKSLMGKFFDFRIDIHNISDTTIDLTRFRFALKTMRYRSFASLTDSKNQIVQPDGSVLIYLSSDKHIFPDDWNSIACTLHRDDDTFKQDASGEIYRIPNALSKEAIIRIISEFGPRDTTVTLEEID